MGGKNFFKQILSAVLALCMLATIFVAMPVASAEGTHATEVIYGGMTLNAHTPYLVYKYSLKEGHEFRTVASRDAMQDAECVIAHFDAATGTLTYENGMAIEKDEFGLEDDFHWNTYVDAVQIDGDYYGAKANGDLTIDLNGKKNFIYCNWARIYNCNAYGIWADGDITIKGDGYLKIPATHAMNLNSEKGDGNATSHTSYGIYATGDVTLEGGTISVFSRPIASGEVGSNATSVGVYADGEIYLDGTTMKFRYEQSVGSGKIQHFGKNPVGIEKYTKVPVKNVVMRGDLASLGFCYINQAVTNNNCFDYYISTAATGIELSKSRTELAVGESEELRAKVLPYNTFDKSVLWSTSNKNIVKVKDGTITGVGTGTATVTAISSDGGYEAKCIVTVKDNREMTYAKVNRVVLKEKEISLKKGEEKVLTATVLPSSAKNKELMWVSSNEAVATVENGLIKAVGAGKAIITARSLATGVEGLCKVTVTGNKPASEIIYCGVKLNRETPYLVTWQDAGCHIRASADDNLFGGDTVLAYFDANSGTLTYKNGMELILEENGYQPDFGWNSSVDAVKIGEDYYGIKANGDLTIDLGKYNNFIYCNWFKIFTCNLYGIYAEGDVTIKGDGYLKIPATLAANLQAENGDNNATPHYSYGIYATGDVNLEGGLVTIFSRNTEDHNSGTNANSIGIYAGGSINMNGTRLRFRYPANVGKGNIQHFGKTPKGIEKWQKTPVEHLKMYDGSLGSLGYCYADESVYNHNCFDYDRAIPVTAITFAEEVLSLNTGEEAELLATVSPSDATNKSIVWKSSNPTVATVDNGVVEGISGGYATITATTVDGGFVAECKVVVIDMGISVKFAVDGQVKTLSRPVEAAGEDLLYVPLVSTFNALGVTMESYVDGVYVGHGNNGEIVVRVGKDTAEVDWVDIELPGPVYEKDGVVMVPAYLIEDALKTQPAVYNKVSKILMATSPDPDDTFKDYTKAKTGEIMKTLTTGTVVARQNDLLVNSGRTGKSYDYTEVRNVPVEIQGIPYTAVEIATSRLLYGEIPEGGRMRYYMRMRDLQDFSEGETGVIHFKARSVDSTADTKASKVQVLYERSSDYQKLAARDFELDYNIWRDYYIPFYAKKLGATLDGSWPASSSTIIFNVGGAPQTIQIADFEVIYYGDTVDIETLDPDVGSYHGVEDDALWRKEAFRRIEKYRKGDVKVTVTDPDGNPVEGAEVEIKQTESEFMFGVEVCKNEIFDLDLTTEVDKLRDEALASFNAAVCGLEMKMGKILLDNGANAVKMAEDFFSRNMRLRGHSVYWDSHMNDFLSETASYHDLSYQELYRRVMDYVETKVFAFRGKVEQWDVLNEIHSDNYIRTTFDTTRLYTDIINRVDEIDPDTEFYVNETNTQGKDKGGFDRVGTLVSLVQRMQDEGAQIDGIGLQTHENTYFYPQGLYKQLDECAQVVDEVAVTEYDFGNFFTENSPKYMADNLIAAFSHPKCEAFLVWGYNANAQSGKLGFFYDINWNEMPFKKIWDKMVLEDFRTNTTLTSDANGCADFRGFYGDYEITVKYDGVEKTFDFGLVKKGRNEINIVIGSGISADVTSGKYIIVPDGMDYASISEAREYFEAEFGKTPYTSIALESRFIGVANQSQIKNATDLSTNTSYQNGEIWASSTGMSTIAFNDGVGKGMEFKNSAKGTFTMSHLYPNDEIYEEGNLEMSYFIETGKTRTAGFEIDFNFLKDDGSVTLGTFKTSARGCFIETLDGKRIYLADSTIYDVKFTLMATEYPGVYNLKYTLMQNNTIVEEIVEEQSLVTSLKALKGVEVSSTASGVENQRMVILRLARVKFCADAPLVTFRDVADGAEPLYETFKHTIESEITSIEDEAYKSGEKWGTNADNAADYFTYFTETDHLFGVRTAPAGEVTVSKKITPLSVGESLEVKFDFYVASPNTNFSSNCHFDVRLESGDGSVSRSLAKYTSSGRRLNLLGDAKGNYATVQTVEGGDLRSTFNRNNLRIVCRFTPNGEGGYDAALTLTNSDGVTLTGVCADILTEAEFLALDTFVIATKTEGQGQAYGKGIAGIKNIVVTSTGATPETEGGVPVFANGDVVGIKFLNPTKRAFDAKLMLVRYVDDRFSSMSECTTADRNEAEGYLTIPVTREKAEENNFLVMLVSDDGTMKPLKAADVIKVN